MYVGGYFSGPRFLPSDPAFTGYDDRNIYRVRGVPQTERFGRTVDLWGCVCAWICPFVLVVAIVLPLCLAYVNAPASLASDTLYLQAGTPVGQTWLVQLPDEGIFASSVSQLTQVHSDHPVVAYQFHDAPPLMHVSTTETPIIPPMVITGGITPTNWAWWGYGVNTGAHINVNVTCSSAQPINVCVDTSQSGFDTWQGMAQAGTYYLSQMNTACYTTAGMVLRPSRHQMRVVHLR